MRVFVSGGWVYTLSSTPVAEWALVALILLAIIAGRRSRLWWLAAGWVTYAVALGAVYVRGRTHISSGSAWLLQTIWLGVTVITSIATPVLLARTRLSSRPVLGVGVLIGGTVGMVAGGLIAIAIACRGATECYGLGL